MLTMDEFALAAGIPDMDRGLLRRALTHSSYVNENPDVLEDNERLEFLGDAALDFHVAEWLYLRFPEVNEGELTRMRAALVRTENLAALAARLRLGEALLLGRGEEASGGRKRITLLCDAFEAVIGALYLDKGMEAVGSFMEVFLEDSIEEVLNEHRLVDARSRLQIWAQARFGETPRYETIGMTGPDHARVFEIKVTLGNGISGIGRGRSKQEAAQHAAADLLDSVGSDADFVLGNGYGC